MFFWPTLSVLQQRARCFFVGKLEKLKSTWVFLTSLSPEFLSVYLFRLSVVFLSFGSFIFLLLADSLPHVFFVNFLYGSQVILGLPSSESFSSA
jgi:hypothetical protein